MRRGGWQWGAALAAAVWCGAADAQPGKTKPAAEKALAAADLPAGAELVTLRSADGVFLVGTYFKAKPGRATGVAVVPNLATHSQREFYALAAEMAQDGVSVFAFDFRGYGQSTALATDSPLVKRPNDTPRLRREDVQRNLTALLGDFDTVKQFLLREHNAQALNIRQFGILAIGDLATAAANMWVATRELGLETPWTRDGGDIAAVGLVSPALVHKQLRVAGSPQYPGEWGAKLPVLVVSAAGKTPGHEAAEKLARGLRLATLGEGDPNDKRYRANSGWMKVGGPQAKGKPVDPGIEILRASDMEKTRAALRGFFKARLAPRKEAPWEGPREIDENVKIAVRQAAAG